MYNSLGAGVRWACHLGEVRLGDTVLVLGAGQRGIGAVVASRAAGAGTIIITGLAADAHKLAVAREFGADHTDRGGRRRAPRTPCERVEEITDGEMADVALELTPLAAGPVSDALLAVRRGGRVVLAGLKGNREIPVRTDVIINRALTIRGAFGVDAKGMADAIALIESRRFPLEKMHTHTFGLDDAALAIETLGGEVPGRVRDPRLGPPARATRPGARSRRFPCSSTPTLTCCRATTRPARPQCFPQHGAGRRGAPTRTLVFGAMRFRARDVFFEAERRVEEAAAPASTPRCSRRCRRCCATTCRSPTAWPWPGTSTSSSRSCAPSTRPG